MRDVAEMTERVPMRAQRLGLLCGNPLLRFWGFEPDAVRYAKAWTSATPKQRRFAAGLGGFLNSAPNLWFFAVGALYGGLLLSAVVFMPVTNSDGMRPLNLLLGLGAVTVAGMTGFLVRLFVAPLRQPKWLPRDVEPEGFAEAVLTEMGPADARTFLVVCRDRGHAEIPRGGECQEFLIRMDEVLNGLRVRRNSESVL